MVESNSPKIDIDELMERVRAEVTHRRSFPPLQPNGSERVVALPEIGRHTPPPPMLAPPQADARGDQLASLHDLLERARQATEVSKRIPKLFRQLFRKQGRYNSLLIQSVIPLFETLDKLIPWQERLSAGFQAQSRWLSDVAQHLNKLQTQTDAVLAHVRSVQNQQDRLAEQTSRFQGQQDQFGTQLNEMGRHLNNLQTHADSQGEHLKNLKTDFGQHLHNLQTQANSQGEHLKNLQIQVGAVLEHVRSVQALQDRLAEHMSRSQGQQDQFGTQLNETGRHLSNLQTQADSQGEHLKNLQSDFGRHLSNLQTQADSQREHLKNLQTQADVVSNQAENSKTKSDDARQIALRVDERQSSDSAFLKSELHLLGRRLLELQSAGSGRGESPTGGISPRIDDHELDAFYVAFENQFRGSRESIKERVRIYLNDVREAGLGGSDSPILDLGCGRGEWLELVIENGFTAEGVDLNAIMVAECKGRGLPITETDALEYLRSLPAESRGVITAFHLIEHLEFRVLVQLLRESLRVLRPGGLAIFETPNPDNVLVGSNRFYSDPTHRHPLPKEYTSFLLRSVGFTGVIIRPLHPDKNALVMEGEAPELRNFLNRLFFSDQDYAVVGRRQPS